MKVVLTGTGAVRVNLKRAGPGQIVDLGDEALLFDCGRCTVHQLVECGYKVENIDRVFITHLHFDHVCDLAYFILLSWNNGREKQLRFHGPPGTAQFLDTCVNKAYARDIASRLAHGKDPSGLRWTVNELTDTTEGVDSGSGYSVDCLKTAHAGLDNLNYRVMAEEKTVVVTSDTQWDPALIEFCRDADCLLCECSGTREFLSQHPWGSWHMTPETVAELVSRAHVKRTVIKHMVIENFTEDPHVSPSMADRIRSLTGADVQVGIDGMVVQL